MTVLVATLPIPPQAKTPDTAAELRGQLSNLDAMLTLAMLMTESGDELQIVRLATTALPSLGRVRCEGVHLRDSGWCAPSAASACERPAAATAQVVSLGGMGGPVDLGDDIWRWAYPLRGLAGHLGHLVAVADREPSAHEQFLLRVLAQHTGVALANARLHRNQRETSAELAAVNGRLEKTVAALERSMAIHQRLTAVATSGEGLEGLTQAIHELTGYPVALEDRYGNLRAWAGPNRPDPYPKESAARREELLRRLLREAGVIRDGGRLIMLASPRDDVLGVLILVDPARTAGDHELVALEHGATVLAMELAKMRSLAEAELRLRRDLVEDLLSGTDEESAVARAQALGYDLERGHHAIVVEGRGRSRDDDTFLHAVSRAARDLRIATLIVARAGAVVLLAAGDIDAERLRQGVLRELGGGVCRIGVGSRCVRPVDVPQSYRQALLALNLQRSSGAPAQATRYDDLGIYRLLSGAQDVRDVEDTVKAWLGPLLAYDELRRAELVKTLATYLECGGSYDATAVALSVHRSTLKYRLQRIREISGHNLGEPDTAFHLQLATRAWRTLQALRQLPVR
jgi:DNA-binding PucR family transcriptional regulator